MARKGKARKTKRTVLAVKDYQAANEKMTYLIALGGVWVLFLGLAAYTGWQAFKPDTGQALKNLWQVPVLLLIYPGVCIMGLNMISARPRRKQLKELGGKAKVMATNHAEVHKLLLDSCKLLSLKKAPAAYIVTDQTPYMYSVPGGAGSIIISSNIFEVLRPEEVVAALAKELGHIKSGHVSVDLAITAIRRSNPFIKFAALPVWLLSTFMRDWLESIEYTADRCSLLVTRRVSTCTASMVKLAAARTRLTELKDRKQRGKKRRSKSAEEEANEAEAADQVMIDVSPEELDAYLASSGEEDDMMSGDVAQVERQFKISRFIDQQKNLRERVRALGDWTDTDQCDVALAKVDEIRQQITR
ncbi:MAG TPA: M48 family metalloprotease [Armatimonadota bacterium]|nr:M48 family metalloprotease [Armatimonadota bacterium]